MIIIQTQVYENYGDVANPYWKPKGGDDVKITEVPEYVSIKDVYDLAEKTLTVEGDDYRCFVIDAFIVEDDYLSEFERSQLEYDGKIIYPERVIKYTELLEKVEV
jgi:hypothetical protein